MEDIREWAKLDARWFEEPKLLMASDECEVAFRLWPVLIGKAKAESSAKRNPDGVVQITPRKLAFDARCEIAEIGPALQALDRHALITCSAEGNQCLSISLVGFARWQNPRGSEAHKKERYRAKKKLQESRENTEASTSCPPDVHPVSTSCPPGVPFVSPRVDKKRVEEIRENKTEKEQTGPVGASTTEAAAADVSPYLPEAVQEACEIAAVTGLRAEWWVSSVQKLRRRYASLPDQAFVNALDWIVVEADGAMLHPQRAWAMLRGSVTRQAANHREQVKDGKGSPVVGVDAAALYWVEQQIGRELTSAEDHALQAGEVSVEVFLAEHGAAVSS